VSTSNVETVSSSRYRLPRTILPSRYEITLEPHLEQARFDGFVSIDIEVLETIDEIVLNSIELELDECWVETEAGDRIETSIVLDDELERATFGPAATLAPGNFQLHIRFRGILNDKLHGFYRSTFTSADGSEHLIATTQFESTDARRAFPCWDEPDFKARFAVTLVVDEHLAAFSNGREISQNPVTNGRRAVAFAETVVMSTYLVAFVVGPLEATDPVDVDGVALRVIHQPGQGHLTDYALDVGAFALRYFGEYYDIPYPGDKIDLIAVPDFAFGAMENLGCIIFREVLLLVDPDAVTQPELQRVADVIAHELAHMWFGDLVTMKWWNGIWLNEAFATFMEMRATDAYRPSWNRWVDFGLSRSAAFDIDSLEATRPIEFPVVSPADAEGMFDLLTYEKGAAVVRMLEQYLGVEPFREGVRTYLVDHSWANTETTDLWDALEATSGQPIRRVMDSWIFQGGYPLISASREGSTVRLAQQRFAYRAGIDAAEWSVPIILALGRGPDRESVRVLLDGPSTSVDVGEDADWVLVNSGGHGFYRVAYREEMLEPLTVHAQDHLESIERYALVDDTYSALLAGRVTSAQYLALLRSLADEDDLSVWARIAGSLGELSRVLDGEDLERFRAFVRDLVGPALDIVGHQPADDEDDRGRELRATLFRTMGTTGQDPATKARARGIHESYLVDPSSVDTSLAAAAVAIIAPEGDRQLFEQFRQRIEMADTPQEEQRYLYALPAFEDPEIMADVLDLAANGGIRTQNAPYVLRLGLWNRARGADVWRFIGENWDGLFETFPSNSIIRMLEGLPGLATHGLTAEVEAFFDTHAVPQGAKMLAQHLERLNVHQALAEREGDGLASALR